MRLDQTAISVEFGDALRIITVMGLAACVGMASVLFCLRVRACLRTEDCAEGLDLAVVTMSFVLLCLFGIAEIQGYYGTPITWRTPIGFFAAGCGLSALWGMLGETGE